LDLIAQLCDFLNILDIFGIWPLGQWLLLDWCVFTNEPVGELRTVRQVFQ
jgi:hypothetical protein